MATDPRFLEYVPEQAAPGPGLSARRMCGGHGLYLDGRFAAGAADASLFLGPTRAGHALPPDAPGARPHPGARVSIRKPAAGRPHRGRAAACRAVS
ncbi:MAG: hypothetical protein C0P65_006070 [Lysobacteraceae bacterium]|jgi:Regulator of competence-specific genes|nr:hypothetical protein [Xanthomonadaceae bacterium]